MNFALSFFDFSAGRHPAWRFAFVLSVGAATLALIVWIGLRTLHRIARRTSTTLDDELLHALRWPAQWTAIAIALLIAIKDIEERHLSRSAEHRLTVLAAALIILPLTIGVSRASIILLRFALSRSASGWHVTTLTAATIRILWAIPGLLVILNLLDISLAPALTALGVGGIAVSLALKDTLANLFAGFYISMAGNIHKGDLIKLDSGQQGFVEDVSWRITTLRTLDNNLVVIPNSKLSEALVTNYTYPSPQMALPIPLSVSYSEDIDRVEQAVLEEVHAAAGLDGLLLDPAPVVRFNPGFGDSSLNLTLVVHISEFTKQFAVQDLLRRRILARFRRDGISIPFPTRTLDLPPGSLKRALDPAGPATASTTPQQS
ncbi:MAG: membrane protein [Bryobacteraceae bacterium]|nr:MAG: membrane protein [Bryobacteraceae bacterium]